eukprot:NODE_9049_length_1450_cov_3.684051.p1 GENE.NODE_9049_length_1450_cov_3.684051~~NODE_9049_length_1450_cov_3.684051.p1  ORF type:complete len:309 (-),score=79.36 NODE_9049_length_1450_cov_3.684051:419-1345(-)
MQSAKDTCMASASRSCSSPEAQREQEARARELAAQFLSPAAAAKHLIHHSPSSDAHLLEHVPWGGMGEVHADAVQEIASQLRLHGWAALRDLGVGRQLLRGALAEAQSLRPRMRPGFISRPGVEMQRDGAKRSDKLVWLTHAVHGTAPSSRLGGTRSSALKASPSLHLRMSAFPCLDRALCAMRVLGYLLAEQLGLDADGHTDVMVTCYAGHGASYVPHVDSDVSDARQLTLVLYLNEGWWHEDGGCLDIMDPELLEWRRVWPELGALAVFRSAEVLHQVRPAHAARYAVSLWISRDGAPAGGWQPCD